MIICALSSYCLLTVDSTINPILEALMKSERPDWLIVVIILLVLGYRVFSRYLKHQERQEKENTKRFEKAMDDVKEIKISENEARKTQSLSSLLRDRPESGNIIAGKFEESNRWQNELYEMATDYVLDEMKDVFSDKATPVCDSKKKKQIKFRKKEKEHIESEIT